MGKHRFLAITRQCVIRFLQILYEDTKSGSNDGLMWKILNFENSTGQKTAIKFWWILYSEIENCSNSFCTLRVPSSCPEQLRNARKSSCRWKTGRCCFAWFIWELGVDRVVNIGAGCPICRADIQRVMRVREGTGTPKCISGTGFVPGPAANGAHGAAGVA